MHLNTPHNDILLLQHPSVGINNWRRAFTYRVPTFWNKFPYKIYNGQSVIALRKLLKNAILDNLR